MKAVIKVVVEYEPGKNGAAPTFTSVKVGDKPAIPLPPDAPAPRRLARDLAEAALTGEPYKAPELEQTKLEDAHEG